jgi:hypothetical protein
LNFGCLSPSAQSKLEHDVLNLEQPTMGASMLCFPSVVLLVEEADDDDGNDKESANYTTTILLASETIFLLLLVTMWFCYC